MRTECFSSTGSVEIPLLGKVFLSGMKKKPMFSKHDDGGVDMINGERRPAIHLLHGSSLSSCQLPLSLLPLTPPPHTPTSLRPHPLSSPAARQEVAVINASDVPPSPIVMEVFFSFFVSLRKKQLQVFRLFLNSTRSNRGKKKEVMDEVVKFRSQLVSASRLAASILSFIPVETHRRVSRSN